MNYQFNQEPNIKKLREEEELKKTLANATVTLLSELIDKLEHLIEQLLDEEEEEIPEEGINEVVYDMSKATQEEWRKRHKK